jgi:Protein of unknown function (DUF2877).
MYFIKAMSIGPAARFLLAKAAGTGRVHSVFKRVINLAFPGQKLISIAHATIGNSPVNIVTDAKDNCGWDGLGVDVGGTGHLQEGFLYLDRLTINLRTAQPWIPAIQKPLGPPLPAHEIASNLLSLRRISAGLATRHGLSPLLPFTDELLLGRCPEIARHDPFLSAAATSIAGITQAIKASDLPALQIHAGKLAGLGPGLTPSGDDLLAGLMAAMLFAQKTHSGSPRKVPAEHLNETILRHTKGKTNDLSRQHLEFSARGEVSETMESLILTLLQGPSSNLNVAARELMKIGASSGSDLLLGILLGSSLLLAC